MRATLTLVVIVVLVVISIALFDFRVTDPGSLPDVSVTGGEMPETEVRGPDVQVETRQEEVSYPADVDVRMRETDIDVPTGVDVELPGDRESEELINE